MKLEELKGTFLYYPFYVEYEQPRIPENVE